MTNEPTTPPQTHDTAPPSVLQPKLTVSWTMLGAVVLIVWLLVFDGWRVLTPNAPPPTIFQTATLERAIVARAPVGNIVIPQPTAPNRITTQASVPPSAPAAIVGMAQVDTATSVATAAPAAQPCVLTTWVDGSQSCDDGRPIDAAHSVPGYCAPIRWADDSVSCNDGKPAGRVIWPDPEVAADPTSTPWPAAPTSAVTWDATDGPHNNTCVSVTFPDHHTQTACSDPNVHLDDNDTAFVARMIEDGRIAPGVGVPKG